jgi:hypothetical protein
LCGVDEWDSLAGVGAGLIAREAN